MSICMDVLDMAVVGPLVADVEGGSDGAPVRVCAMVAEINVTIFKDHIFYQKGKRNVLVIKAEHLCP